VKTDLVKKIEEHTLKAMWKGEAMNVMARVFQELIATLRVAPESYRADDLCSEVVAWLAHMPEHYALVAFIHQGNVESYRWHDGTLKFLSLYGIYLRKREHAKHKGWFIFAELHPNTVSVRQKHPKSDQIHYVDSLAA
jgi:hypothetical protein